jgi:hypothetical protein
MAESNHVETPGSPQEKIPAQQSTEELKVKGTCTAEKFYEREQALEAKRRRNRQIVELTRTAQRPTILPSTKRWIASQIELLKSGVATGQGGGRA